MRYLSIPIQIVFTFYAFLIFTTVLVLILPFVLAASFFGTIRGGNYIYRLCRIWAKSFLWSIGIFHRNSFEVPHDITKQYVFVFNHISYLDAPLILKAIQNQHIRVLGKAELANIPLFGYIYKRIVVMVQRDNAEHRAKSVVRLKAVLRTGISIMISPEGTFNLTGKPLKDFYDGAFKIAIETQTAIKPILFLDAFDRMSYKSVISLRPGKSRAVYLDEIKVKGLTLNDVPLLKEKVYKIMEEKLIAYNAGWIKP